MTYEAMMPKELDRRVKWQMFQYLLSYIHLMEHFILKWSHIIVRKLRVLRHNGQLEWMKQAILLTLQNMDYIV